MFSPSSPVNMALASSAGIFLGMLPIYPFRLAASVLLSAAAGWNLPAILVGLVIATIIPALQYLTMVLDQWFGHYSIPFYTMRYQKLSKLLEWTKIDRVNLLSSVISGIVLSGVLFLLFYLIYKKIMFRQHDGVEKPFVFSDKRGLRWPFAKIVIVVAACAFATVLAMVATSINITPVLPAWNYTNGNNIANINPITAKLNINTITKSLYQQGNNGKHGKRRKAVQADSSHTNSRKVFGFYVNWDAGSLSSLRTNIHSMNYVIPNWFTADAAGNITKDVTPEVDSLIKSSSVSELPSVSNYDSNVGNFSADIAHALCSNPAVQKIFIHNLETAVKSGGYAGINIDFENLGASDSASFVTFISRLYSAFHSAKLLVTADVPAQNGSYQYQKIIRYCDYMIVMAYDEHDEKGSPGSVASLQWVRQTFDSMSITGNKLIMGIANYGYDWVLGSDAQADEMTFQDVMAKCSENKLNVNWDAKTGNPFVTYSENGKDHVIWFLDAATLVNQEKLSENYGCGGIALWRLGAEDPTAWKAISKLGGSQSAPASEIAHAIQRIDTDISISYTGSGEILHVNSQGSLGERRFTVDRNGTFTGETYLSYPEGYVIQRLGKPKSKQLALTFDDGPDPYYTPRVLDILEKNNVKASFFVIGENVEVNPDILQRIYKDGDNIGNHTFTHPNIARVSSQRTQYELNATQRIIEEVTGHSTILFRPPYAADAEPGNMEELIPVIRAQQMGYAMVGELIDPLDWTSPKPDVLFSRIVGSLGSGNVILLHDGGGNRDSTLTMLPKLITWLKGHGYELVTINQLMGRSRDAVMPAASSGTPYLSYDKTFFKLAFWWNRSVTFLFYLTITLGVFKLLFLMFFSLRQYLNRGKERFTGGYSPLVSIIIPAYNEEKVICATVDSALGSAYPNFEIIVLDDGSTDRTYETLAAKYTGSGRVTCVRKRNGGKASALNQGIAMARGEIFVAIDADTILDKNAVSLLVRHFIDPKVAAVSGNVKIGNRKKLLPLFQHCEYVNGFNLERRAYSQLNCITVVPGALGAWRKSMVLRAGCFKDDTLAEDTDLTMTLLTDDVKILYEEKAYAFTESPEDVKSLMKQRFRWAFGTLQCMWKHREQTFDPNRKTLGFIAIPFVWIFQYGFQLLAPVVDIYMIFSLFNKITLNIVYAFLAFLLLDLFVAIYSFSLEKENLAPLLLLPVQRVVYRVLMAIIVIRSVFAAVRGRVIGWNKLKRTGNVTMPGQLAE